MKQATLPFVRTPLGALPLTNLGRAAELNQRPPPTESDVHDDAVDYAIERLNELVENPPESRKTLLSEISALKKELEGRRAGKRKRHDIGAREEPPLKLQRLVGPPVAPEIIKQPLPPPVQVDTKAYVFEKVWSLVSALYEDRPDHPMFGPCEEGLIRAPYSLPGGTGAATSWHKKVTNFAGTVAKGTGATFVPGGCWLVPGVDSAIQSRPPGAPLVRFVTYKTTRWLSFLANPTDENWVLLSGHLNGGGNKPGATPFLHFCHNGHASRDKHASGCVNGVEHGRFGTVLENNRQKDCKSGSYATCPGHGDGRRCIFVHSGCGSPKPCLNDPHGMPESCQHEKRCF